MTIKHTCVIDAENRYRTFVRIVDDIPQCYEMQEGETLLDTDPPILHYTAGDGGLLSPVWDAGASAWVEGATAEEVAAYDAAHPSPTESAAYKIAVLKQQLAATDYQAIKYAEGWISEEEYADTKAERQSLRDQINALEAEASVTSANE